MECLHLGFIGYKHHIIYTVERVKSPNTYFTKLINLKDNCKLFPSCLFEIGLGKDRPELLQGQKDVVLYSADGNAEFLAYFLV